MRQETPYYLADVVPDPKNHDYAINIGFFIIIIIINYNKFIIN